MLRILLPADDHILPQAKQEIYFFNRIDPKRSFTRMEDAVTSNRPVTERREQHIYNLSDCLALNLWWLRTLAELSLNEQGHLRAVCLEQESDDVASGSIRLSACDVAPRQQQGLVAMAR